ncbi:MAG: LppX_LprAFG lipoprotein [Anaerolineaceae bacterium]|nr:LppX_LprAFG lipoprotein [Anaerolineaceae bacterium]
MYRLVSLMLIVLLLAGCGENPTPEALPDSIDLLTEAATNVRASQTLRLDVERTGADYEIETDYGSVNFKRAVAQYIAPDVLQATVRVLAAGLPIDVDIFSKGEDQWFRGIWTANIWVNAMFAPGFNPERLISQEAGFQAALQALINISTPTLGELEDGTPVYHLTGTAKGEDITALMVGLIEASGNVLVDVFIDRNLLLPVRFIIVQPETITDEEPEPTTWTVDVYDVNAEPKLNAPPEGIE